MNSLRNTASRHRPAHGHCKVHPGVTAAAPRLQPVTVCRYDLRKSANNVEERRRIRMPQTTAAERALDPEELKQAKATLVHQRAYTLSGATKGQLSHHMCLFLLTEQPQLLSIDTKVLAARIASLSDVLGLSQADVAELLVRCGAVLDVLPLRFNSAAEALSVALGLPKPQSLVMLAADLNLLDTPALRVRQQLEALAELLQVSFATICEMASSCPYLLRVEAAALQIRWANLQSLLQLNQHQLLQLLQQEPRLLMPSTQNLTQNHTAICQTLGMDPQTLNRWIAAAPMLLLVPAQQLLARVEALKSLLLRDAAIMRIPCNPTADAAAEGQQQQQQQQPQLDDFTHSRALGEEDASSSSSTSEGWVCVASDPVQFRAYISKDPRVLLLSPKEIPAQLAVVQQELCCGWSLMVWLIAQHPSYLAVEPGSITAWMYDVRHLCQITAQQAIRLALCPEVFLTCSPEEVLMSLTSLSKLLQLHFPSAIYLAHREPLLLLQPPAVTAAAMLQLQQVVPERQLRQQLLRSAPELLLLGPQLQQRLPAAAAVLSLSPSQLAVALVKDPGLWWVLVPRHTWRQQQQQQRQQQQLTPAAARAVESMAALTSCGLRSAAAMQEVAVFQPMLLQLGPAAVQQLLHELTAAVEGCVQWQQQIYSSLPPELLGTTICKMSSELWKIKLKFMIECGFSERVSFHEFVEMSKAEFERAFGPEFVKWKADYMEYERQLLWRQQRKLWQQQQQPRQQEQSDQLDAYAGSQQQAARSASQRTSDEFAAGHLREPVAAAAAAAAAGSSKGQSRLFGSADGWHDRDAADGADEGSAAELQQQQRQQQRHWQWQQQQQESDGEGDVFYADDETLPWGSSGGAGSSSGSSSNNSSQTYGLGDGQHISWKQQQQQQQRRMNDGEPAAEQHYHLTPLMHKADQLLLAVQQSGLELYGTWEGCLLQPAAQLQQPAAAQWQQPVAQQQQQQQPQV